jgi:Spy/CpxP family protein refolding chaperone
MAVVALAVGVSLLAALPVAAQENAGPKVGVVVMERIQDLDLTEGQEAKIEAIRKEFRPKVKASGEALVALVKDEVGKVRAVLTPEQKTTLEGLKEERQHHRAESLAERVAHLEALDLTEAELARIVEIRKEYRPKMREALEGLLGLLSEEQKQARQVALKAGKPRREVVASLKLTDAQKAKVEAVGKELGMLFREEASKIREVLTEAQKEKLQDVKEERRERVRDRHAHRIAHLKSLNLSDAQKNEIAEIRKEYRPKIHEAGNMLRAVIREEVESILAVIKG